MIELEFELIWGVGDEEATDEVEKDLKLKVEEIC